MAMLRELPWYQAILGESREQGLRECLEQTGQEDLMQVLEYRFGNLPPASVGADGAISSSSSDA